MPSKRARSLIRAAPTNHYTAETQQQIDEEPVYDSDEDSNVNPLATSSSAGNTVPIGLANSVTEIRAPVVLGNVAENTAPIGLANSVANNMAPIGLANAVTNTAISLSAAADIMDHDILQMGIVVPTEHTVQDLTQQTVFNMRNAVFLTDTVNETLANSFLIQAQDPTFVSLTVSVKKTAFLILTVCWVRS